MRALIQKKVHHDGALERGRHAADASPLIPKPQGWLQRAWFIGSRAVAATALALALPSVAQAFTGNFSVTDQTIVGTGCPVGFVSQSSSGSAWVTFVSNDRMAGGSIWNSNANQAYPVYTPPGYPTGLPLPGGPVTVADLQTCGLSNITNLVQNGADGASRLADAYMGFRFRATSGGSTYDYEVAIVGATGTTHVNTRTPVSGPPTITVNPSSMSNATVGAPYNVTFSGSGGTAPYAFAITAGALPAGLSVNLATGAVTGTPTAAGNFSLTVRATDANSYTGSRPYSFSVAPPVMALSPTTSSLPGGTVAAAYSQTLSASGGISPYTYAVVAGSLPTGLALNTTTGVISGTPTAGGTFNPTFRATGSSTGAGAPHFVERPYTLVIAPPTIVVSPLTLPNPAVASAYSQTVSASGGTAGYTFLLTAGALPAGMTLSSGGAVSGTPTASGPFSFTIGARDSSTGTGPYTGVRTYSGTVAAPVLNLLPTSLPNGAVAAAYNQAFSTTGGTTPYTYAITAGALPAGLSLSPAGALAGTPTTGGTFNFTVTSTDSTTGASSHSTSRGYSLTIAAPTVTVSPPTLPNGTVASAYSQTLTASGGTASYSFALSPGGALPNGLSLSAAGVLSGTPTTGGSFNFSVTATDSSTGSGPYTGTQAYTVTVAKVPQTLTFPAQSPASHGFVNGGTFAVNPVATSDSPANPARPIAYSSSTPAVCTVAGTTVTMVTSGACTIAADQVGDAGYDAAAQVTQTVAIDGIKAFSGTTVPGPGGTAGPASASFTGGGAACGFDLSSTAFAGAGAAPPPGKMLPQGMFGFRLIGCDVGSTVTMSVVWPQPIAEYGKYGLAAVGDTTDTWFTPPGLGIAGNTATFTITDGGVGDSDAAGGVIADPTGPLAPALPVPTLGEWGLLLMAALMGALGLRRLRRTQTA